MAAAMFADALQRWSNLPARLRYSDRLVMTRGTYGSVVRARYWPTKYSYRRSEHRAIPSHWTAHRALAGVWL
jgi:hypothetical protein